MFLPVLSQMISQIQIAYPESAVDLSPQAADFNTLSLSFGITIAPLISQWIFQENAFGHSLVTYAVLCFSYALFYILFVGGYSSFTESIFASEDQANNGGIYA